MSQASAKKRAARVSLRFLSLFILSWFIVAFGQPARLSALCPVAAICGFAVFWVGAQEIQSKRFWWSSLWYCCVQLIQLSWFTSIEYQGYYILGVYGFLCIALGLQFGLLTQFLLSSHLQFKRVLGAASLWTLMEWGRLFVLCGFSWNPVGLALTGHAYSMQFANIWGIYGLSFWVILVNGFLYRAVVLRHMTHLFIGASLALAPYLYGFLCLSFFSSASSRNVSIGLIQTGLLPSQKVPLPGRLNELVEPLDQWKRILSNLHEEDRFWDLLVFPEAVVPMRADYCCYPYNQVLEGLQEIYGSGWLQYRPPPIFPYARHQPLENGRLLCASNLFFAQMLANKYNAEVIIGLDHYEPVSRSYYNSAFHCAPQSEQIQRYDKQILLPLAEYLPFSSLQKLTERYGINAFFSHGKQSKVFGKNILLSPSICYEETFPHVMRRGRVQGAELLVNVTNDNYYPFSQLPEQHLTHARIRAVENGVPLVRACNTGVTAGIDRFGRIIARFGVDATRFETDQGILSIDLPLESHQTIYLFWGDAGIIGLACIFLLAAFLCRKKNIPDLASSLRFGKVGSQSLNQQSDAESV